MTELHMSELFRSQSDYHTVRIPALVTSTSGTILAFCEGRRGGGADDVPIDLLLRRSLDGGRTWSASQVVVSDGDRTCGNPCPVVDSNTGDIVLPFCKDNQQLFVTRSVDDGLSWDEAIDISADARQASWSYVGCGPGHGVQLSNGRLLIPSWADESPGAVTWREPGANWGKVQTSYAFYSDDGGQHWHVGEKMTHDASDECEAVELGELEKRVYMTLRSRHDQPRPGVCLERRRWPQLDTGSLRRCSAGTILSGQCDRPGRIFSGQRSPCKHGGASAAHHPSQR